MKREKGPDGWIVTPMRKEKRRVKESKPVEVPVMDFRKVKHGQPGK